MQYKTSIQGVFSCSLERAFKSPMLCDITKVHTGYGFMPKVTHCTDDDSWGQVGGTRRVYMSGNVFFKAGEAMLDKVVERVENNYWVIELTDFKFPSMGFNKFKGEWKTEQRPNGNILITYTYTLYSKWGILFLFHWCFVKIFWRIYMRHVMENVKQLAYGNDPYMHN